MGVTLASKLDGIAKDLRREVSKAVKDGANVVVEAARDKAPIEDGDLRDSIQVERADAAKYRVYADANSGDGEWVNYYAQWVEFGSVHNPTPRPFLIPALEESKEEIVGMVEDVLGDL